MILTCTSIILKIEYSSMHEIITEESVFELNDPLASTQLFLL